MRINLSLEEISGIWIVSCAPAAGSGLSALFGSFDQEKHAFVNREDMLAAIPGLVTKAIAKASATANKVELP